MKRLSYLVFLGLFTISCAVASYADRAAKPTSSNSVAPKTSPSTDDGERAFKANCSRCHYAPETLNPRITGTVIRHMRVRANLSAADEHAIRHYLNP